GPRRAREEQADAEAEEVEEHGRPVPLLGLLPAAEISRDLVWNATDVLAPVLSLSLSPPLSPFPVLLFSSPSLAGRVRPRPCDGDRHRPAPLQAQRPLAPPRRRPRRLPRPRPRRHGGAAAGLS